MHDIAVMAMTFSRDGEMLATGDTEGVVKVRLLPACLPACHMVHGWMGGCMTIMGLLALSAHSKAPRTRPSAAPHTHRALHPSNHTDLEAVDGEVPAPPGPRALQGSVYFHQSLRA